MAVAHVKARSGATVRPSGGDVIVSGSLAYDLIMDFPGLFHDHILPGHIHDLNISFFLSGLRQSDGGTAGNIAYNLSLLGVRPTILGVAGPDFFPYRERLAKQSIDVSRIKIIPNAKTATAHIITDRSDNQIAAFYPGPLPVSYAKRSAAGLHKAVLAIVSADDKMRMLDYISVYKSRHIPYIFDPGQAVIAFSAAELRRSLDGAKVLIGNDYEISLIADRLGLKIPALNRLVPTIVVTKGAKGSEICEAGRCRKVPAAKPIGTSDPTGAGDAYRAGFIKGLLYGYDQETCARLGSVAAVYTVEKYGTQTHRYSLAAFRKRYFENYREKINL